MSSISEYYWRKQKHDSQRYAVDLRTVHATENVQFSPAPRHNFSRGDELSSDNPIRRGKRALLAEGDVGLFFLFFSECSSTLYDQYTRKYYFPNVGGTILTSHFRGRHSRAPEIREVEVCPILRKNVEDTGQKPSPGRHREFRICETHPYAGNAFPRNYTGLTSFKILRKTKFRQIFMV